MEVGEEKGMGEEGEKEGRGEEGRGREKEREDGEREETSVIQLCWDVEEAGGP